MYIYTYIYIYIFIYIYIYIYQGQVIQEQLCWRLGSMHKRVHLDHNWLFKGMFHTKEELLDTQITLYHYSLPRLRKERQICVQPRIESKIL